MFHIIPDAFAITRANGLFKQTQVYHYNDRIFVKHGAGFAWVLYNGDTSIPKLRLEEIELPFPEEYSRLGYLMMPGKGEKKNNKKKR